MQNNEMLHDNYVFWKNITRGFVEDETGDKTIHVNGRDVTGYWVYGYIIPINEEWYIYGGRTVNDINNPVNKYPIISDTQCKCTGFLTETETGWKPVFMYDIVCIKNKMRTIVNQTVFWDAVECGWYLCDFDNYKMGESTQMTARLNIKVTGTVFDKKV